MITVMNEPKFIGLFSAALGQEAKQGSVHHCLSKEKRGVRDGAAEHGDEICGGRAPQEQGDTHYSAVSGAAKHKDVCACSVPPRVKQK